MDLDDIFADEIEDGPPSIQSSGRSILGDTPQTNAAALFRPPEPRNTTSSVSSRSSASRNSVKKFAKLLKLTKENQETLLQMSNHTLPGEEYIGMLAALIYACQEGIGSSGSKWVAGRVIRDTFKEKVAEFIFQPDLEAFSKTVAEDHTTMLKSLEILTFDYLKGLSPEFVDDYCPGDYVANEPCIPGTAMYLFIEETLKNQRSKVRTELLTNILGVPDESAALVPAAKSMVLSVARVMLPHARVLRDDNLLKDLGREKIKWIIFMRYVTVWYHLNHTVNKKRCQWTVMDEVLADLRARPDTDRKMYFDRIVHYDRATFDGKQSWPTIKAGQSLPTPDVEGVLAPDDRLQGSSSGDLNMEDGGEEED
ncbi:hypothetical protein DFH28DRAFT_1121233 [Melampsora americana]|nr:hypothetical protein DFH28DRAFT_1121233 [Melampsora americana]